MMINKGKALVALATLVTWGGLGLAAHAQATPEEQAVLAVVQRLFDGMRAGDSTAVRAVFDDGATLSSVSLREGVPVVHTGSIDRFVEAVGTPHEEVWDERIWAPEARVDGPMATAWVPYAFYLGDTFSHCGVNAFTLVQRPEGWKVRAITDTRRREGCEVPPEAK